MEVSGGYWKYIVAGIPNYFIERFIGLMRRFTPRMGGSIRRLGC
jgi:hypothetical protein